MFLHYPTILVLTPNIQSLKSTNCPILSYIYIWLPVLFLGLCYKWEEKNSICYYMKDGRSTSSDFVSRCFALNTQNRKEKEKGGPKSAYHSIFNLTC